MDEQNRNGGGSGTEDDRYVLEDDGSSVEDLEHEMEVVAEEAAAEPGARGAAAPAPESSETGETSAEGGDSVMRDRYLRTLADFENFRKRAEREKQDFYKYAMAGLLKDILPVLDNFDRALEHAEEGDDFHKGVLMIYKQLADALKRHGLRAIEESGVRFDPNLHEAVVRVEDPSVPSHWVVEILQKGYFLHDRLLRPALVKVAVGGPEENGS